MNPTRPAPLDDEEMDAESLALFERWRLNGRLYNVFRMLSHNPRLAKAWVAFGGYIFARTGLTVRQSELVILRTTWRCGSVYEWSHHLETSVRRRALNASDHQAIVDGPDSPHWAPQEASLIRAADELEDFVELTDATWDELTDFLDTPTILDVIYTCGAYRIGATATNSLRLPLESDVPTPAWRPASRRS